MQSYSAVVVSRPPWAFAAAALAALVLAGGGSTAPTPACNGSQLAGTFTAIPGSAGAGNIVYALRIRLRSGRTCFVTGVPRLQLLDRLRRPLPTKVTPAFRPGLAAVRVLLRRGQVARATARFSPDVPGPGEPVTATACERRSYYVRVTPPPGRGTFVAPVRPPTPVCEHGRLAVSALGPA
jgi:Domain of unknown function (DUF4232)